MAEWGRCGYKTMNEWDRKQSIVLIHVHNSDPAVRFCSSPQEASYKCNCLSSSFCMWRFFTDSCVFIAISICCRSHSTQNIAPFNIWSLAFETWTQLNWVEVWFKPFHFSSVWIVLSTLATVQPKQLNSMVPPRWACMIWLMMKRFDILNFLPFVLSSCHQPINLSCSSCLVNIMRTCIRFLTVLDMIMNSVPPVRQIRSHPRHLDKQCNWVSLFGCCKLLGW